MLFEKEALPRSRGRIKRMHVADGGVSFNEIRLECVHCGYDDGWSYHSDKTLTELKRGIPCPQCNKKEEKADA